MLLLPLMSDSDNRKALVESTSFVCSILNHTDDPSMFKKL